MRVNISVNVCVFSVLISSPQGDYVFVRVLEESNAGGMRFRIIKQRGKKSAGEKDMRECW